MHYHPQYTLIPNSVRQKKILVTLTLVGIAGQLKRAMRGHFIRDRVWQTYQYKMLLELSVSN